MQEVRELIGTRAEFTDHLAKLRDELQTDARRMTGKANAANRERLHGRAEGVELALRELAVWTQTDAGRTDPPARQDGTGGDGQHGPF